MRPGVELVNAALLHLGVDPVATLDTLPEGSIANRVAGRLPAVRDAVLRSYLWNCAETVAALPAEPLTAPAFGMAYRAALPAGNIDDPLPWCLRVRRVDTREPWAVQGRWLYHNQAGPLTISYTARVEDPSLMDPLLTELIGGELALALSGSVGTAELRARRRELFELVRQMRQEARRVDATENSARRLANGDTGSWVRPRKGW